jgi:bacteriophage exclusion system BrxC/D-like protein
LPPTINQTQATKTFRYLKRGVFPPEQIMRFTVGRSKEFRTINNALDKVSLGTSDHFFLQADYGLGKSHMLRAIESLAKKSNFAVTHVVMDGYAHAFNHPARYLHSILENLTIPETELKGLGKLVHYWLKSPKRESLLKWARHFNSDRELTYAILNMSTDNYDHFKRILESRHIQHKTGRSSYSIFYKKIETLGKLCHAVGLKGIVILFDEVETISTLLANIRSRLLSYEILNNFVRAKYYPYSCFFFAITPDFGFKINADGENYLNYKYQYAEGLKFVVKWLENDLNILQLLSISKTENLRLCCSLKILHEFAYAWSSSNRISDQFVEAFVDEAAKFSLTQREIIKSFVNILEVCQQNPSCEPCDELQILEPKELEQTIMCSVAAVEDEEITVYDGEHIYFLDFDDVVNDLGHSFFETGDKIEISSSLLNH